MIEFVRAAGAEAGSSDAMMPVAPSLRPSRRLIRARKFVCCLSVFMLAPVLPSPCPHDSKNAVARRMIKLSYEIGVCPDT